MRKSKTTTVALIEELAANAWPSYIEKKMGNWKIRATFGVSKRANSVYTAGPFPAQSNWLEKIQTFYIKQSISPCFYISEESPKELDELLSKEGYKKIDDCFSMIASYTSLLPFRSSFTFQDLNEVNDAWIMDFIKLEGFSPERFKAYTHIFSSITPPKNFIRIVENGETLGVGSIVVENGWGCISNIVVASSHRRKGIAKELVCYLSDWAYKKGACNIYLQVIQTNIPALHLYEKLGFEPLSSHHYRMLTLNT
ncbi:GNAT family N-acetyltransferase [Priestia endophytica]|jgi:GNAT superfamily N-acetyltransferase|uniref:GNAT family N-acetyltransferase n=1 Tax=Priestia endophytica TaxID=135735 RepID=UPI00124E6912|nr:GNAT family N-acetyltransferase [Priestia endophytica]KAB2492853.1 GNAT family N-acetyltransferase [Priestia endophytica]